MRVGICCAGIGPTASAAFVAQSAQAAEQAGFSTFWLGDHVVLFDDYSRSKYPYAGDFGTDVPIPDPTMAMIDPVIALTWAAASTTKIEVGTGIVILPQRNPVVLAKELASLDALSGGRVIFGAGLGWCVEEYEAIGTPWAGRGKRMDEAIGAMRALWEQKASSFQGDTVRFDQTYCFPKPARPGGLPILIGGESDAALKRVARHGDGWIAFKLSAEEAAGRIATLRELTRAEGRDPSALRLVVGIFSTTSIDDLKRYRDAGITDFNLVTGGELPMDEPGLRAHIGRWGEQFVEAVAKF